MFEQHDKNYRKQLKQDKTEHVMHICSKELDTRDRWMGIRQLKQGYQPTPYHRKSRKGEHVKLRNRAGATAEYLAKDHWGKIEDYIPAILPSTNIVKKELKFRTTEITVEEIKHRLRKFKRRKAPGPDGIPMEFFLEMDKKSFEVISENLNTWWEEEQVPPEVLQARVVSIYKKGDTSKLENYRPISLLNSIYKIYAAVIQERLAEGLDNELQITQYGFRKNKSTRQAIHIIRRLTDVGERTGKKLKLLLLDTPSVGLSMGEKL